MKRQRSHEEFTAYEISLLGTDRDTNVARMINRAQNVVRRKRLALNIPDHKQMRPVLAWTQVEALDQSEFIKVMIHELSAHLDRRVTYSDLCRITLYSLSRMQKWATAGTAQEPLVHTVRHHIWLAVMMRIMSGSEEWTTA